MMKSVKLTPRSIREYEGLVGDETLTEIEELAAPLRGARVLHVNATARGGGVAELLPVLVALKRGLGLEAEWHVLAAGKSFFELTKKLHHGLQGMDVELTPALRGVYFSTLKSNLKTVRQDWDFVVAHDPQPAGLVGLLDGRRSGHWIWRCHIDTSTPAAAAVEFLAPFMGGYDVTIFTLPEYVDARLSPKRSEFVYPSIDPLSPKNQAISRPLAREILASRFGTDPHRPLMTQVSRFNSWKDPLGVLDAYRAVKRRIPHVQLALVGDLADDDPEGVRYHARTLDHAGSDPDVHVFSNLDRLSRNELTHALEVNAFQSGSDVIIQKSTREGFGLVVAEAMWKQAAVVASRVGGLVEQIDNGVNGYLVSDVDECADRAVELLEAPDLRQEMGSRARESVRCRFLTPRHLLDYLRIFRSLS
jgi:trehalose synthase